MNFGGAPWNHSVAHGKCKCLQSTMDKYRNMLSYDQDFAVSKGFILPQYLFVLNNWVFNKNILHHKLYISKSLNKLSYEVYINSINQYYTEVRFLNLRLSDS